jgi:hypothetical protein
VCVCDFAYQHACVPNVFLIFIYLFILKNWEGGGLHLGITPQLSLKSPPGPRDKTASKQTA